LTRVPKLDQLQSDLAVTFVGKREKKNCQSIVWGWGGIHSVRTVKNQTYYAKI